MQRLEKYLDQRRGKNVDVTASSISGDEAAKLLSALSDDSLDSHVLFDTKEADRLGLSKGDYVAVVDADAPGGVPTVGKLVG